MERRGNAGFSLIELLLVVAIIGIISGIAIPSFLGQRARARSIGDAQATAQTLRMALESYKADNGVYGGAGSTYVWTGAYKGAAPGGNGLTQLPSFSTGNSKMNYYLSVGATQLSYTLNVKDPSIGSTLIFTTTQTGSSTSYIK